VRPLDGSRFRVSAAFLLGPIDGNMHQKLKRQAGLTLTELLCVMAIILILAALYLPAIARAYHRIRAFLGGMSG
jgi:prepilin-type N-terminal cleavage/methylation domain-containing protein